MTTSLASRPLRAAAVFVALALSAAAALHASQQQVKPPLPAAPQGGRDAAAPAQPTGTGVVAGTLVSAASGKPVRRGRVSLSGTEPRYGRSVTTDDQGHFSFTEVPAGLFDLTASKAGFLDVTYGQKQPGNGRAGTPIQLVSSQRMENVKLAIPKGGVLTGTVVDEGGDPAFGVQVRALRYVMRTGERSLQSAGSATTDDRGIYRIPNLLPGEYVVSVTPPQDSNLDAMKMQAELVAATANQGGGAAQELAMVDLKMAMARANLASDVVDPTSAYAPVYYPGTTTPSGAATIALGPSEERSGVDVPLQLVLVARINGSVTGLDGQPGSGVQVQLIDLGQPLPGMGTRGARTGSDGKFSFAAVPPGQYSVIARGAAQAAMKVQLDSSGGGSVSKEMALAAAVANTASTGAAWAISDISVDGRNPVTVPLQLRPGMPVAGRVVFEGASAPPDPTRVRVSVAAISPGVDAGMQMTSLDAMGNFAIPGLAPGRYRFSVIGAPPALKLKSVMTGGRDALDSPLEVKAGEDVGGVVATLSDKSTVVSGMLQDSGGQPATDYTVIAFSADSRFWMPNSRRIQAARPATTGAFTFRDLPPGDYLLVAVTDVETGQWYDPAFLRQLQGSAASMKLAEGERKTQTLRVK
jgi:uncharacterized protein (DUF2141 family)